jgi:hypothetical protein
VILLRAASWSPVGASGDVDDRVEASIGDSLHEFIGRMVGQGKQPELDAMHRILENHSRPGRCAIFGDIALDQLMARPRSVIGIG